MHDKEQGRPPILQRGLLLLAVAFGSWLFFIDFCNLAFQCGCRSLWAGAATHCNIHNQGGPHCPWCADAWSGPLVLAMITVAQAGILFFPGPLKLLPRLLLAISAFPLIGGLMALVFGLARGYWSG